MTFVLLRNISSDMSERFVALGCSRIEATPMSFESDGDDRAQGRTIGRARARHGVGKALPRS